MQQREGPPPRFFRGFRRIRPQEIDPLFVAISTDNFCQFKALLEGGKSANMKNARGFTPLACVIEKRRMEFFDYLLSLDNVDIESKVQLGWTPLLYAAAICAPGHFARSLIAKGADVHAYDDSGFTYLHLAARNRDEDSLQVGKTVIEMGADVNARACYGMTPLYIACEEGNFDWVCMLLYYGADPAIPSAKGVLPVAVVSPFIPLEEQQRLQDILFDYTFDEIDTSVQLSTLAQSMTLASPLFRRIVDSGARVVYDSLDLVHLYSILIHLRPEHFKIFIRKYGYIVRELIEAYPPLTMLVGLGFDLELPELREILLIFLESDLVDSFVRTADVNFNTVSSLVKMFNHCENAVEEEEVTKIVLLMVSYGLKVTAEDMETVYKYYDRNELFEILLHMDIGLEHVDELTPTMARLYYDVNADVDLFLQNSSFISGLFSYYNNAKLKELCLSTSINEEIKDRVRKMPSVPHLLELSRNVTRKYLVERYKIKNSMQFYTVVKWLPIGEMTKLIITIERKLY